AAPADRGARAASHRALKARAGARGEMKVEDRRHWARADGDDPASGAPAEETGAVEAPARGGVDPAELEAMRVRAEGAERRLREVQEAFVAAKLELDRTRERLERDLDRKVAIRFGDLVADLLETADDLDRAIEAGRAAPESIALTEGVVLARDRFLGALQRAGIARIDPTGQIFDPNVAEAVGVAPVDDPGRRNEVVR